MSTTVGAFIHSDMAVTKPAVSPATLTSPHRTSNRAPMQPNVSNVVLGNLHIKPWFPSFYPEDMVGGRKADWLYVCPWCFKYTHEIMKYSAHCVCFSRIACGRREANESEQESVSAEG